MSTIATPTMPSGTIPWRLVWRFVWKEMRRMRGFALGVAALALLLMLFARAIVQSSDIEELRMFLLLFPSFGGGAFVAIGAAITAYAVEREEQTDSFLYALPRYPLMTFLGKSIAVLLLAVVFTLVLAAIGWCVGGFRWPRAGSMDRAVLAGFTLLFEATAWGLLISALVPRPLLAAVLACAATSFGSQVAIGVTGGLAYAADDHYYQNIPARLALSGVVLLLAAVLSRRWMLGTPSTSRARSGRKTDSLREQYTSTMPRSSALTPALAQQTLQPVADATRRGIVWRLAWQTWRESWKTMLGVLVGGLLLMLAIEALAQSSGVRSRAELPLSVFFIPGLCGAMAFRQDHRRGQVQFLAEHAGRPRLVWLVRVAGWALYLVLLSVPVVLVTLWAVSKVVLPQLEDFALTAWSNAVAADWQVRAGDLSYYYVLNFSLAAFTAFAIGQLASQLIKSEILAAGVSIFASLAVLVFSYLIVAWRLPPVWCHLPIIIGCLAATYIRAPDWIAGRHTVPRWAGMGLAAVFSLAVVVLSIPMIRGWQIDRAATDFKDFQRAVYASQPQNPRLAPVNLSHRLVDYQVQQREAEEVSRRYREVLQDIYDSQPPSENQATDFRYGGEFVGNPESQTTDMTGFAGREGSAMVGEAMEGELVEGEFGGAGFGGEVFGESGSNEGGFIESGFDGGELSANELSGGEFGAGAAMGGAAMGGRASEAESAASLIVTTEQIDRLVELTKEPALQMSWNDTWPNQVAELLTADARHALDAGDLDLAWDRLLALERLRSQVLHDGSVLGTYVNAAQNLDIDNAAQDELLVDWAIAPQQTSERLKQAAADMKVVQQGYPPLDHTALVYYATARQALEGGVLDWRPEEDWHTALFLDQLPGEHERATEALDLLAAMSMAYLHRTGALVGEPLRNQIQLTNRGEYGYPFVTDSVEANVRTERQWRTASSSMLAGNIWNSAAGLNGQLIGALNQQIYQSLKRLRLALIAYHLDHDAYPARLQELVPDYLPALAVDPYSGEAFQYAPRIYERTIWGEEAWPQDGQRDRFAPMIWSVGPSNALAKEIIVDPKLGVEVFEAEDLQSPWALPLIVPETPFNDRLRGALSDPSLRYRGDFPAVVLPSDDEYPEE